VAKVFISYRRTDSSQIVGRIDDRLEAAFGRKNVFRDLDSIHGGANFVGKINEAINQTDVALIVIGPHWIDATDDKGNRRLDNPRDFVRLEVEAALNRDSCRTIPILVSGAHMPNDTMFPDSLKPLALRNAMSVRDDPDFRRDMERVLEEIKTPSGISLQPIAARVGNILNSPLIIAVITGLFVLVAAFLASWLPPYLQAQQQNGTATAQALVLPGSATPIGVSVALIVSPTSSATPSMTNIPASATNKPMSVILVTAPAPDTPVSAEDSASTLDAQDAQTAVAAQTLTATRFTHTPTATRTPTIDTSSTVNAIRTQRVIGTHAAQLTLIAARWTRTPTPSFTPTYTATPTITPTLTPIPPTVTNVPSTATPIPPTPTATPPPAGTVRTDAAGIAQVFVPNGCFMMGSDPAKDSQARPDEQPQHKVCLTHDYWIDQYDVTNAAFDAFVKAGGYSTDAFWSSDGLAWKQSNKISGPDTTCTQYSSEPQQPRVCVSWYEAEAYAKWRTQTAKDGTNYQLPTEAEWEYAARGPQSFIYPWGDGWDSSKANVENTIGKTSLVNQYPAGKSWVGAYDMAGNVWQWTADWYDAKYNSTPQSDPPGASSGQYRALRGGSWDAQQSSARSAYRPPFDPAGRNSVSGFRVVLVSRPF